ncbi:hypothetical protein IO90_13615 [Chryseobacterium sp. FH1]|nr:hypothetical protein IO90_13615 [Chryseobacterium sp. FH1]
MFENPKGSISVAVGEIEGRDSAKPNLWFFGIFPLNPKGSISVAVGETYGCSICGLAPNPKGLISIAVGETYGTC